MTVTEMRAGVGARSPALFISDAVCLEERRLVLVGDHRSQFQLQQNTGEDAAGIVVHDDAVMIAVFEQLARPPERFKFGTEILGPLHRTAVSFGGHQAVVIANSVRHLVPQGFWQEVGSATFPLKILAVRRPPQSSAVPSWSFRRTLQVLGNMRVSERSD